jgi:hypothetical protein
MLHFNADKHKLTCMNDEPKRDRSPNYPKMPLEQGVGLASELHKKAGKSVVKPQVAVGALGYTSLNGAALTTLGALSQYGLIERPKGDGIAISALALRLLHPLNEVQLLSAKREAALRPKVFYSLFSGGFHRSDGELIRNHLIQEGFTPDGAQKAANVFKANAEYAILMDDNFKLADEAESNTLSKVSREPYGQFVYPKPTDQPPDISAPPLPSALSAGELSLPLESGKVIKIPKMTEDDYALFIETLQLWKRRIIIKPPTEQFPFVALWKNKDFDKMVKIVGLMGEKEGQKYYQSEDGTGIPEREIFPDAKS